MLAVGRALLGNPRLLMLDEPSLGLAPRIVGEVMRTVLWLREGGVSVLLVEQNARATLHVADYGCAGERPSGGGGGGCGIARHLPRDRSLSGRGR
jgi:branched-chain amino acid transport system ATP-binding protein